MCETRPLSHFHLTYFKVGVQRCCSADLGCNQCLFELLLPTILPAFDLCPLALTRHTPPHSADAANWIFSLFQTRVTSIPFSSPILMLAMNSSKMSSSSDVFMPKSVEKLTCDWLICNLCPKVIERCT